MILLEDYISVRTIITEDDTEKKESIINDLTKLISTVHELSNPDNIHQKIMNREALVSTGIGYGVAVPHSRLESIEKPILGAALIRNGVDFQAIDGKPVNLIFLLLSSEGNNREHHEILSMLSHLMSYERVRQVLSIAEDPAAFLSLLISAERKYRNKSSQQQQGAER
ncbi:MAG: PTS sugar transporter subunit IIA [Chitinivibrionales bacterium]